MVWSRFEKMAADVETENARRYSTRVTELHWLFSKLKLSQQIPRVSLPPNLHRSASQIPRDIFKITKESIRIEPLVD